MLKHKLKIKRVKSGLANCKYKKTHKTRWWAKIIARRHLNHVYFINFKK